MSSIIPSGFELTCHPIFHKFVMSNHNPCGSSYISFLNFPKNQVKEVITTETEKKIEILTVANQVQCPKVDANAGTVAGDPSEAEITQFDFEAVMSEDQDRRCPICLESIVDPVTLVICHHSFCYPCISQWFRRQARCPVCKAGKLAFLRCVRPGDFLHLELWKFRQGSEGSRSRKRRISGQLVQQAVELYKTKFYVQQTF
jgi:hypothetical protein